MLERDFRFDRTSRQMICPHCGDQAYLVASAPHPVLGPVAELCSFECRDCLREITVTMRS